MACLLGMCGLLLAVGCDEEPEDDDAGMTEVDAGLDPDGPAVDCMARCQAKATDECSAPPTIAMMRCGTICGTEPTEGQVVCVEDVACDALMMSFFSMELAECEISFGMDGGPPVADAGPDAGVEVDAGEEVDAGDVDAGEAPDAGDDDAGMVDAGDTVMCVERCTTKLVTGCESPNPAMAAGRCESLCDATTTDATVTCFEAETCPNIIMAFMSGGTMPVPCFED